MQFLSLPGPETPCLLYHAHGRSSFCDQAVFSLLSLHGRAPQTDARIIVFADQPERFVGLAHHIIPYSPAEAKVDAGRFQFVHRAKILFLMRVIERFPHATGWMAVDADTIWSRPPETLLQNLQQGSAIMWNEEGFLGPNLLGKIERGLRRLRPDLAEVLVRNSGLVGLPNAGARDALEEVLTLTDGLLVECLQRNWAEQIAFSVVLPQRYEIVLGDHDVQHYWNASKEMIEVLRLFFRDVADRDPWGQAQATVAFDPLFAARAVQSALRNADPLWLQHLMKLRRSCRKRLIDADAIWTRYLG
jgi:hypothetical protein